MNPKPILFELDGLCSLASLKLYVARHVVRSAVRSRVIMVIMQHLAAILLLMKQQNPQRNMDTHAQAYSMYMYARAKLSKLLTHTYPVQIANTVSTYYTTNLVLHV